MTHLSHSARLSRLMRSQELDDRRRYHRFDQHGLVARIGNTLHRIVDVSVGGIRIDGLTVPVGGEVTMTLHERNGNRLDVTHSLVARGQVVGYVGTCARIRFPFMSFTLAKFLIQHLARRQGVQPYIFK